MFRNNEEFEGPRLHLQSWCLSLELSVPGQCNTLTRCGLQCDTRVQTSISDDFAVDDAPAFSVMVGKHPGAEHC